MYDFTYHRPESLEEAAATRASADEPELMGGGQSLLPTLKQRLAQPSDLVDLGAIAEFERDVMVERIKSGLERAKASQRPITMQLVMIRPT